MINEQTRAVVTGGAQGLGFAIASRLIAEGCRQIAIADRDEAKGAEAAVRLSAQGCEVHFIAADISRIEDCRGLVAAAAERLGPLNALVNSAASTDRSGLLDTTPELWSRIMDTNARGPFFTMQAFVKQALDAGIEASIVNIVSMLYHCGQSFLAPYSASKAALVNITKNTAQAQRTNRIRCNAVACGWMDTPGEDAIQKRFHDAPVDWLRQVEAKQPFGRLIKVEEVAPLVTYLLSPQSGVMTGAVIDIDQHVTGAYPE